jgi:integrase/recombinase XerD
MKRPYGPTDVWERDNALKIVEYVPELRDKVIVTLLWDFDARPHEVTALKVGDIRLEEQCGIGKFHITPKPEVDRFC